MFIDVLSGAPSRSDIHVACLSPVNDPVACSTSSGTTSAYNSLSSARPSEFGGQINVKADQARPYRVSSTSLVKPIADEKDAAKHFDMSTRQLVRRLQSITDTLLSAEDHCFAISEGPVHVDSKLTSSVSLSR